jgi:hypothetical protein
MILQQNKIIEKWQIVKVLNKEGPKIDCKVIEGKSSRYEVKRDKKI